MDIFDAKKARELADKNAKKVKDNMLRDFITEIEKGILEAVRNGNYRFTFHSTALSNFTESERKTIWKPFSDLGYTIYEKTTNVTKEVVGYEFRW